MPLTPQDVVRKEFREAFRGYNQADVDLFLDEVVEEMHRLVEENQRMKVRVTALQQELARYRPGEPVPPPETSEARWRLRRFLEEQGRPLDELQPARSATMERIAREVPKGTEEPPSAPSQQPPAVPGYQPPRAGDPDPAPPQPAAPTRPDRAPEAGDEIQVSERPWERDAKPFWAAE